MQLIKKQKHMKNFKIVIIAFAVSIVGLSCSSDDDNNNNNSSNNVMSIAGETFDIASAGLENYGENADGSFDWDVYLFGDGITIDNSTPVGQGAYIYLDLNTNNADGLVAGTYTFAQDRAPFTWVYADACTNFNISNFNCASGSYYASTGTVVISGSGSSTSVEVNLQDSAGASITASYTGGFSVLD